MTSTFTTGNSSGNDNLSRSVFTEQNNLPIGTRKKSNTKERPDIVLGISVKTRDIWERFGSLHIVLDVSNKNGSSEQGQNKNTIHETSTINLLSLDTV